ncbi:MAG: hypothetical protein AAGA48_05840 [Myxococcota bacterium]
MPLPLIALLACTNDPSGPDDPVVLDPGIELGTGLDRFVSLDDGDDIVIIFGPQGGYHLEGSILVQGIDPGSANDLSDPRNPLTTFQVRREDGTIVSGLQGADTVDFRQGIAASDTPGVYQMIGRRILLDIQDDSELEGQTLTVSVTVEDADGVSLSDERAVIGVASFYND